MDGHSHFHRKKIGSSLLVADGTPKQIAFAAPSIAEISQRTENSCGASPVFAETSPIPLGTYATC
jgi:hypothetical protein